MPHASLSGVKPGSYSYPPDEFDAAARAGGPRGVHREPRTRWSKLWPFVVVLVVFPALAFAAVTILSDWDGLSGLRGDDDGTQQAAPGDGGDLESDPADTPDEALEETPEPEQTPEPPPPPPLDVARPVDVYNATNRAGLAGNASGRLEAIGFSDVSALNWDGQNPATSIVYYPTAQDVTTAQTIATTLGIAQVVESAADTPNGKIVVVLANDYQTA